MASIKMGAMITAIAGKTGGTVFRRGKTGQTMSNIATVRPTPLNNVFCAYIPTWGWRCCLSGGFGLGTVCQNSFWGEYSFQARKGVVKSSIAWRTLTDDQRNSWATGASSFPRKNKFGDDYTPSGFQLFCELNGNLTNNGFDNIQECPAPVSISVDYDPVFITNSKNVANVQLGIALRTNESLQIMASGSFSLGRKKPQGGYKMICNISVPTIQIFDISTQLNDRYGYNLLGNQIGFKWRIVNSATGQASAWSYSYYHTIEGIGMDVIISAVVTGTGLTCVSTVTTETSGCASAALYSVPDYPTSNEFELVATLTPNTTQTHIVTLVSNTLFVLVATDADGFKVMKPVYSVYVP